MVSFTIELHKVGVVCLTYTSKYLVEVFQHSGGKNFTAVLGHEDQMNMH